MRKCNLMKVSAGAQEIIVRKKADHANWERR